MTLRKLAFHNHVLLAVCGGLLARLVYVLVCHPDLLSGDELWYDQVARNLVRFGIYSADAAPPITPTTYRAPLPSFAFALAYGASGGARWAAQLLQSIASVAGMATLALGAARHLPRLRIPLVWILCVFPFGGALFCARLLSEALTGASLAAAVGLLLLYAPLPLGALAGICLGLLDLSREVYLPLVVALPLAAAFFSARPGERRGAARNAALCMGVALLVVSPWSARNKRVASAALLSQAPVGRGLFIGTWEREPSWSVSGADAYPDYAYDSPEQKAALAALESSPAEQDAMFRAIAVGRLRDHPGRTVGLWIVRSRYLWLGSRTDVFAFRPSWLARGTPLWVALKSSAWALNCLTFLAALFGAFRVLRDRSPLRLLLVAPIYNYLAYLPLHSTEIRYTEPAFPCVIVLAVVGLDALIRKVRPGLPAEAAREPETPTIGPQMPSPG